MLGFDADGKLKEYFMPSSDHVRVVRMLVKHVHSFVYAKGPDVHQLPILHPSDELRRNIIPQFLQKKLYYFFNHCFSHWPLDPSFKFVLETWLSFIQPWRYSKSTSQGGGSGGDESRETASPQWKSFVFDNLLFYSALLLEFVSRACRFNLCSAKDAHLLFRVVKVFAQQNLVDMVEEGENILLVPSRDHWHGPQGSMAPSSSALRAHIVDLEGPSYVYEPVFCKPGAAKVDELQSRVLAALSETTSKSQPSQQSSVNTNGFIGWIKDVFGSSGLQENGFDRKAEEGKLVTYLEQASTLLSSIVRGCDNFDGVLNRTIPWENSSPVTGHRHVSLPGAQATLPDHVETDTGVVPTPLGRYQMMNGLRKFEVRYTGDPELQPIRSFENPTLVRLLYKLSTHLNEKCGKSLQNFYTNSRVFRSIVCFTSPAFRSPASSPTPPRYSSTSSSHSPQTTLITPRISLRFLASYKTLLYLFIFWLLCQVVSMNRFLVLLLWICVLLVMLLYHFVPGFEKSYKAVSSRKES